MLPSEGGFTPPPSTPNVRALANRMSLSAKNSDKNEARNAIGIRGPISLIEYRVWMLSWLITTMPPTRTNRP